MTGVTAISAGFEHSLFLKGDGAVFSTGNNSFGELGDGTEFDRTAPVEISFQNFAAGATRMNSLL